MWIRRVRTGSGATAVQLVESFGGRRRIVAHVGSAHTEAELGLLIERARDLMANPGRGEFPLGIEPRAPKTPLLGPAGDPTLFPAGGSAPASDPGTVPGPRVLSTSSRVLYDALVGCSPISGSTRSAIRCSGTW